MERKIRARISGTGSYVPPRVMTNADFEKLVDTSDEWIVSRTGIRERRIAADDMTSADMAMEAARRAMDMAGCTHEDIDLIISGTVTPDYRLPSNSCVMQEKMGFPNAVAFDVVAACAGFINGMSIADSYISSGAHRRALVIGTEKLSYFTNYKDRNTCVLFGDGAGAVVLEPCDSGSGVLSTFMKSNGSMRSWLWSKVGGSRNPYMADFAFDGSDKIQMAGSEIFKVAVKEMSNAAATVIKDAGISSDDVSLFVPHQANIRIVEAMAKRLHLGMDRVFLNIHKYGNTSSASVPLALDEANREGRIKPGDYVVMVAFGGGLIWGSALVKW
ncbi:MAG: 3-oxoacyl-ACP synthase [Candidatus Zixiibacteriota bacterium]|nr:MAG: 3-oxoacyl-ACP synthase [candidate division Zixibacteria bacterium]